MKSLVLSIDQTLVIVDPHQALYDLLNFGGHSIPSLPNDKINIFQYCKDALSFYCFPVQVTDTFVNRVIRLEATINTFIDKLSLEGTAEL